MANLPITRGLAALGAVAVLGIGAAGVAWAQTPPTATPTRPAGQPAQSPDQRYQRFLETLAAKLGVTTDRLRQAITETRQSLGLPDRGPHFGFGGRGFGGRGFAGVSLDAAASAIGISVDQLRQELRGKSLADVARAHNVDPNRVASALKADAAARIDQAVASGRLGADRAAQLKQDANTRIDHLMTQQIPASGAGAHGLWGKARKSGTPSATATPTPQAQR
jgi:hypothetical protein